MAGHNYTVVSMQHTVKVNEAGLPVEMVEVIFNYGTNKQGKIYVSPTITGKDTLKQAIVDYIDRFNLE